MTNTIGPLTALEQHELDVPDCDDPNCEFITVPECGLKRCQLPFRHTHKEL